MEFQLKFDATPAAVSFAEGLRVFGLGLSAYAKMQPPASSIPGVGATKAVHKPADEEPAPTVEKPAPEPARQAAANRREARQLPRPSGIRTRIS